MAELNARREGKRKYDFYHKVAGLKEKWLDPKATFEQASDFVKGQGYNLVARRQEEFSSFGNNRIIDLGSEYEVQQAQASASAATAAGDANVGYDPETIGGQNSAPTAGAAGFGSSRRRSDSATNGR